MSVLKLKQRINVGKSQKIRTAGWTALSQRAVKNKQTNKQRRREFYFWHPHPKCSCNRHKPSTAPCFARTATALNLLRAGDGCFLPTFAFAWGVAFDAPVPIFLLRGQQHVKGLKQLGLEIWIVVFHHRGVSAPDMTTSKTKYILQWGRNWIVNLKGLKQLWNKSLEAQVLTLIPDVDPSVEFDIALEPLNHNFKIAWLIMLVYKTK